MSSTKRICEILTPTKVLYPTWKPHSKPLSSVFFKIQLNTSMTKRNKRGDKGSPCLKPHELPKKPTGDPFTNTEKQIVVTRAFPPSLLKTHSAQKIKQRIQFTCFFYIQLADYTWDTALQSAIQVLIRNEDWI